MPLWIAQNKTDSAHAYANEYGIQQRQQHHHQFNLSLNELPFRMEFKARTVRIKIPKHDLSLALQRCMWIEKSTNHSIELDVIICFFFLSVQFRLCEPFCFIIFLLYSPVFYLISFAVFFPVCLFVWLPLLLLLVFNHLLRCVPYMSPFFRAQHHLLLWLCARSLLHRCFTPLTLIIYLIFFIVFQYSFSCESNVLTVSHHQVMCAFVLVFLFRFLHTFA